MLKWIVVIAVMLLLLSSASPLNFTLHGPGFVWDGGLFSGLLALAGFLLAFAVMGMVLFVTLGSALLMLLGLPLLLVVLVVALAFAPILIPALILLGLIGLMAKTVAWVIA